MATTSTYNTSASDGYIYKSDATYATAHDAVTADGVLYTGSTIMTIGQNASYQINRIFLYFDTSAIPDDATIISAKIRLKTATNGDQNADTDFNIVVRRNTAGTYPGDPMVTTDFNYTFYTGDGGSINTADMGAQGTLNYIHLNATGLSWINKTGYTKLALISSRDINSITPTGNEYFVVTAQESGTTGIPQLTVVYAVETYPSVTTQAATNIKDVSVKGNGTLTDGLVATAYGFEYGLTETPTWSVNKTSNIAEGAFSLAITGLTPSTTYYYRSYATNSYGTTYGGWVSFTTKASPSYGIYEETNTVSYRLYVSDDEAIAWRGYKGPYTGKQTLINITDITNKTKGIKVLKILPDAKGTFHVCVTLKEEIKS